MVKKGAKAYKLEDMRGGGGIEIKPDAPRLVRKPRKGEIGILAWNRYGEFIVVYIAVGELEKDLPMFMSELRITGL